MYVYKSPVHVRISSLWKFCVSVCREWACLSRTQTLQPKNTQRAKESKTDENRLTSREYNVIRSEHRAHSSCAYKLCTQLLLLLLHRYERACCRTLSVPIREIHRIEKPLSKHRLCVSVYGDLYCAHTTLQHACICFVLKANEVQRQRKKNTTIISECTFEEKKGIALTQFTVRAGASVENRIKYGRSQRCN